MRAFALVLMLAGLASGQATPNWKGDGHSLLQFCSAYVQAAEKGSIASMGAIDATFCAGFLTGIQDFDLMLSQAEIVRNAPSGLIQHACIPASTTTDESVRAVVEWLRENPDKLQYPASVLAIDALRYAFPCRK